MPQSRPIPLPTDNAFTLVEREGLNDSLRWDWTFPENRWDHYYPYQLAILQTQTQGEFGGGGPEGGGGLVGGARYSLYKGLTFTLPYAPESMQTMMPFAISVQATQDGVVEQHGGVPFRQIVFQGSFGVYADRPRSLPTTGAIGGIAGGSFHAVVGLVDAVQSLGGNSNPPSNLMEDGEVAMGSTGYFQALQLRRFLESYAEMKKTSAGKDLRLALITWKEKDCWLVTPMRFEVNRQAQSPFEYRYSLQFQSWKRVNPNWIASAPGFSVPRVLTRSPGFFQKILNVLQQVRKVLNKLVAAIDAVRADVQTVTEILRTAAMLVKLAVGAAMALADLPASVVATFVEGAQEAWDILASSFVGVTDPTLIAQVAAVNEEVGQGRENSGTGKPNRGGGDVGGQSRKDSPTLKNLLSDKSGGAYDFQAGLNLSNMRLTPQQQKNIDDETQRVLSLSSKDYAKMREDLLAFMASFSDQVGLSNSTYDLEMGRSRVPQARTATLDDYRVLHALGSAASAIGFLVSGSPPQQAPTVIEYVAGLANANGIAMRVPNSKFVVPFPYGGSLEKLAQQYLNDSTRWMEIAELNELRAPYVDETGTTVPLLVNGKGNTIVVADASEMLIGQMVFLWSILSNHEKRHIVNIQQNGTNWVLTLDGTNDLAKLKTVDHASLRYYQPGTVNSQQVIFIPSDTPATEDVLKYVPSADDFTRILDKGEVDGMLTEQGDLVVTLDGDWPFVLGYANLVQWARVALNTKRGGMPLHTDFGLTSRVGESNADVTATDLLKDVNKTITYNPSFLGVNAASVTLNGPTLALGLELRVRGSDALLPISFDVSLTSEG